MPSATLLMTAVSQLSPLLGVRLTQSAVPGRAAQASATPRRPSLAPSARASSAGQAPVCKRVQSPHSDEIGLDRLVDPSAARPMPAGSGAGWRGDQRLVEPIEPGSRAGWHGSSGSSDRRAGRSCPAQAAASCRLPTAPVPRQSSREQMPLACSSGRSVAGSSLLAARSPSKRAVRQSSAAASRERADDAHDRERPRPRLARRGRDPVPAQLAALAAQPVADRRRADRQEPLVAPVQIRCRSAAAHQRRRSRPWPELVDLVAGEPARRGSAQARRRPQSTSTVSS